MKKTAPKKGTRTPKKGTKKLAAAYSVERKPIARSGEAAKQTLSEVQAILNGLTSWKAKNGKEMCCFSLDGSNDQGIEIEKSILIAAWHQITMKVTLAAVLGEVNATEKLAFVCIMAFIQNGGAR